jgi:hypothetical protein
MNGDGFRFRTGIGHTHSPFQPKLLACDSGTPSYLPHNDRSGYALSNTWESRGKRQQLPPAIDPSLWKRSVVRLNHLPTNRSCRSGFLRDMGFSKENNPHACRAPARHGSLLMAMLPASRQQHDWGFSETPFTQQGLLTDSPLSPALTFRARNRSCPRPNFLPTISMLRMVRGTLLP